MVTRQQFVAGILCTILLPQASGFEGASTGSALHAGATSHERRAAGTLTDSIPVLHGNPGDYGKSVFVDVRKGKADSSLNVLYSPDTSVHVRARYHEEVSESGLSAVTTPETIGAWNLRFDYAASGDALIFYGETDFSGITPARTDGPAWQDTQGINTGFRGERGRLSYGASLGARGKDHRWMAKRNEFHNKLGTLSLGSNKQGGEAWGSCDFGRLSIRGSLSRFSDHWRRSRIEGAPIADERRLGIRANTTLLEQPLISASASYYRGQRASRYPGKNGLKLSNPFHQMSGTLSYKGKRTGASLRSHFHRNGSARNPTYHSSRNSVLSVGAWHSPIAGLTLGSQLGFSRYGYEQSNALTRKRQASLSLAYAPQRADVRFSVQGRYASNRNAAWSQDNRQIDLHTSVKTWLTDAELGHGQFALSLSYSRFVDRMVAGARQDDLTAWLVFRTFATSPRPGLSGFDTPASTSSN